MSLYYNKSRPASADLEKLLAPVFPQTPFPEVRKLTKTTLSGNRKLLAASRHLSSNGTGSDKNVAYPYLSLRTVAYQYLALPIVAYRYLSLLLVA